MYLDQVTKTESVAAATEWVKEIVGVRDTSHIVRVDWVLAPWGRVQGVFLDVESHLPSSPHPADQMSLFHPSPLPSDLEGLQFRGDISLMRLCPCRLSVWCPLFSQQKVWVSCY